ncbi:sensor histidine kinase [Streptomyces sp. NPDC020983]|uniref:sensor histidine kinase n=1 Tax=Streptomyces sp. NPDC020983 TaxID=3365106 RepID=UPI0037B74C9B
MSFRLRVLGLLVLVALTATAATAWLALRQANRQVQEAVSAGQQEVSDIVDGLRGYGYAHGTWQGAGATVLQLARRTGQRIQVLTESGAPVADSDTLAGGEPRPGSRPAALVDARPTVRLPHMGTPWESVKLMATAIASYRSSAPYAACLTGAGVPVTVRPGLYGIPQASTGHRPAQCAEPTAGNDPQTPQDVARLRTCEQVPGLAACLQRIFNERTDAVAPARLVVRLGYRNESPPTLAAAPAASAAAGVALAVVLGALLLGRAVLRPVRAMTHAATALGDGDLGQRVPASGRDEIAELAAAFNRMADSLQAAEDRQRRLTGDIAHELRTPLANLRGYLEALRDGVVAPTPDLLASLHEETLLQQRIVDDLHDLALAEAGALTYHRREVDLRDVLDAARTAHRGQAAAAGVALVTEAPRPVPVTADPDRIRQVVGNLVVNALRATGRDGRVTLAALTRRGRAVIEVRDTGTGIPAADLPHLFDRFWRADPARGRTTGGSGLGLAIARQIVTDHGGTVEARSTVGAGTTFTITLPAAPGHRQEAAAPPPSDSR